MSNALPGTLGELYRYAVSRLSGYGIENPAFEAACLINHHFGFDRAFLITHPQTALNDTASFAEAIDRRGTGVPLQYIIGKWAFFGYEFFVGSGALIPRPETELLTENVLSHIDTSGISSPVVYDLCAGTGCIGISVALKRPDATVYSFELSDAAFSYLEKNIAFHNVSNVIPVKTDVLQEPPVGLPPPDIIVSNPPYIPSADIPSLQREVQLEPHIALDGGNDGLHFYRAIAMHWSALLKPHGAILVECGISQAQTVAELFSSAGLTAVAVINDYSGIARIVTASACPNL